MPDLDTQENEENESMPLRCKFFYCVSWSAKKTNKWMGSK